MAVGRILVVALGVAFLAGGVAAGGFGWLNYQETQADLQNTVEVNGTVENATIVSDERMVDADDDGQPDETRTVYRPVVAYTYSYENETYRDDSIFPGGDTSYDDRSEAEAVVSEFTEGEPVTVKLNAAEPSRSFLIAEDDSLTTLVILAAVGALGVVVGLVTIKRGLFGATDD